MAPALTWKGILIDLFHLTNGFCTPQIADVWEDAVEQGAPFLIQDHAVPSEDNRILGCCEVVLMPRALINSGCSVILVCRAEIGLPVHRTGKGHWTNGDVW